MSIDDPMAVEDNRVPADEEKETEKAEDRAAAITESMDKKIEAYRTIAILIILWQSRNTSCSNTNRGVGETVECARRLCGATWGL